MTKTVFVGMSGGVDSSVSAGLLKEQGYNVVGVHLKCWNVDGCADQDAEDARRACEVLGIPFYVFDFEKEYKEKVVEYMVNGYRSGITPNPDVMCNHEIKFGLFFERAMAMGADFVATGHYARIASDSGVVPVLNVVNDVGVVNEKRIQRAQRYNERSDRTIRAFSLLAGKDKNKDQSYFLWMLTQRQLAKTIFPIGNLKKSKVRQIAKKFNLPNAGKKDSQGVCFLGQISLDAFLADFIPKKKGKILGESGQLLGQHSGVHNFTIGQRHGLGVGGFKEPHYVAEKNIKTNTLILAPRSDKRVKKNEIVLMDTNFIGVITNNANKKGNPPSRKATDGRGIANKEGGREVLVRFRYRQELQKAELFVVGDVGSVGNGKKKKRNSNTSTRSADSLQQSSGQAGQASSVQDKQGGSTTPTFILHFEKPQEFIATGQSAVIYDLRGEEVLGGGVIKQSH